MDYVRELQKYIPVDIYGNCGTMQCPKPMEACQKKCVCIIIPCRIPFSINSSSLPSAMLTPHPSVKMLTETYRFYLAFENSVCKGYITEKLWDQGLRSLVAPVVLKDAYVRPYMPNNSYLAIDQFPTVQEFAARIKFLMDNNEEYTKFVLDWRREYKVGANFTKNFPKFKIDHILQVIFMNGLQHDIHERPWGFCRLCRLIQQQPRKSFTIDSFQKFHITNACDNGELVTKILQQSQKLPRDKSP
jgi:hypothetical protein